MVFLLKAQLDRDAIGQISQQLLQLGTVDRGEFDGHAGEPRGWPDSPAFQLADEVERRRGRVAQSNARFVARARSVAVAEDVARRR